MMKTLLSGTAVALLLVANPALAQTTDEPNDDQVQIEAQDDQDEQDEFEALEEDTEAAEPDDIDDPETEAAEFEDDELDTDAAEVEADVDEAEVAEQPERPTETFLTMQEEDDVLASELMDAEVENPEGETLGSISDVVIHDELGIKAVVIGVGGFLGIGQKSVAVNYAEIERVRDNGAVTLVFAATEEDLDAAPEFQTLEDQIAEAERQEMETQQEAPPTGLD
jgi:sporulation protein YlmC with PRC-barrel domain